MGAIIWFAIIIFIIVKAVNKNAKATQGQRMNPPRMNQPTMSQPSMNPSRMNQPVMNKPRVNQPVMNQTAKPSQQELKARLMEKYQIDSKGSDILARANNNANEYAEDQLHEKQCGQQMDNHMMHHETKPEFDQGSLLGDVEDLMIKGYSGNLDFERDFLGEAMDMLNSFTIPDEIPNMMKESKSA